jgi:hypothetical protein
VDADVAQCAGMGKKLILKAFLATSRRILRMWTHYD